MEGFIFISLWLVDSEQDSPLKSKLVLQWCCGWDSPNSCSTQNEILKLVKGARIFSVHSDFWILNRLRWFLQEGNSHFFSISETYRLVSHRFMLHTHRQLPVQPQGGKIVMEKLQIKNKMKACVYFDKDLSSCNKAKWSQNSCT